MSEQQNYDPNSQPVDAYIVSRQDIQEAFHAADREFYGIGVDDNFRAQCQQWGVDADDPSRPDYWRSVASFAFDEAQARREEQGQNAEIDAFELAAVAPAYVIEQAALAGNRFGSYDERQAARQTVSYFNGLLRTFAYNYPEVRASDMEGMLMKVTGRSIEDRTLRQVAGQMLHASIRGAQHEAAFGQILQASGRQFREASQEEDLAGIDYVVDDGRGNALFVDVKASLDKIEARGSDKLYAVKQEPRQQSRIMMYSMVKDAQLHDTFWIPEELAVTLAPTLNDQLQKAARVA